MKNTISRFSHPATHGAKALASGSAKQSGSILSRQELRQIVLAMLG
jgi:hypothetical protein